MAVKKFKPYTPSRRFMTVADFSEITKTEPEKSLVKPLKKTGGRNNQGRISGPRQDPIHRHARSRASCTRSSACWL